MDLERFTTLLPANAGCLVGNDDFHPWVWFASCYLCCRESGYSRDILVFLWEALKVVARASFGKDETAQPMVSHLAAKLPGSKSG